ncbi:hypothetical protein STENM223S_05498 [Streptomyces tendae]
MDARHVVVRAGREYRNWRKAVEKSLGWVEEGED